MREFVLSSVPNDIVLFVYFNGVHLLCGAQYLHRVVLTQIVHCCFELCVLVSGTDGHDLKHASFSLEFSTVKPKHDSLTTECVLLCFM